MANDDGGRSPGHQRKLASALRRDEEMIAFCNRMAKEAARSQSVSVRRDAAYWRELAEYIRTTDSSGKPLGDRGVLANTSRLEKLQRGIDFVGHLRDQEVAQLREAGLSWRIIGEAVDMTAEGARRRWQSEA